MGLFDAFKKKPEEKKQETPVTTVQETPHSPSVSAEEVAEKIMILIPYIRQYRSQGMGDEEIVTFLGEHDWPESIVRKALKHA